MSSTLKMEREDGGPDQYVCGNCEEVWTFDQLHNIADLTQRIGPGVPCPAGECPDDDCGALCYPVEIEDPRVSSDPDINWRNNAIQFPRLICEIADTVLRDEDYGKIAASMDLTREQLNELFERASDVWEKIKIDRTYPVPDGKQRKAGVEYGCGKANCTDCYEDAR